MRNQPNPGFANYRKSYRMSSIYDFPNLPLAVQQAILNGPAETPPDGTIPDFTNPPNRNGVALAIIVVCISLTALALLCRVYSRAFLVKRLHIEDCPFFTYLKLETSSGVLS